MAGATLALAIVTAARAPKSSPDARGVGLDSNMDGDGSLSAETARATRGRARRKNMTPLQMMHNSVQMDDSRHLWRID